MQCPHCDVTLMMADRQGVEIDYCPKCRGVWLDRGELDKLIEKSAAEAAPPPGPASGRGYGDGGRADYDRGGYDRNNRGDYRGHSGQPHKYHKKKSLLGELFDF